MAKIFVYRSGGITTAGIEGYANPLEEGIKKYQKNSRRFCVDFSPIFREKDDRLFLVGNVYIPEVCTAVFYQHLDGRVQNTSVSCHGTSDDAIELLKDFGRVLEVRTDEPSEQFKRELLISHGPIEHLWRMAEGTGRSNQKVILATSLGIMQRRYEAQKARGE
jgi:hypothetical protein